MPPFKNKLMRNLPVFFFGLFLFASFSSLAQKPVKAIIRGNVYDKESAQPIAFATIQLSGAGIGGATDMNGFFTLANVEPGKYSLKVSYLGYEDYTEDVTLKAGDILYKNIYIAESGNKLDEVVISGKKEQARTEVQISKLTVTPKQIRSLPSAGGQADIAQYLTVLPGVIFTGDQGGQLYIRGGSPVQNRIVLDGMTIYNPFHSIGFFSVFETELIRSADVLTGGFNADYGGRISAIVDVKTREGNRKRLSGLASASPFQAKLLLEGPIVPLKEGKDASVSFVLTGKQALIDQTSKALYNNLDSSGIPFTYRDVYGKVTFLSGNGSKINLFGFNFDDGVDFPITNFGWKSSGGGMDFNLIPANSNTIIGGAFNFSGYDSRIEEADRKERTSGISGFYAGLNFTNYGRNSEFKYGLELTGFRTEFKFINFRDIPIEQIENTTEIAGFLRWKLKFGPLVVEPSFRVQYYQSLNDVSPEPRLGLKLNVTDKIRLKAAGGLYSQNLLSTVNERDIVNLFVGFLSGPEETLYQLDGKTPVKHRLQKAVHGVGGFEFDLGPTVDLNVEGYYKDFTQLIGLNRNKLLTTDPNFITETGKAYGLDLTLKWEGPRAYVWTAYSLGRVTRDDGEQVYPPVFDRRHNLNIVSTYMLGKKKEWEAGARWNFGSGFPFTLTQGYYSSFPFNNGIGSDVYGGNGDLGIIYAEKRNSGRLPYYHRLDISLKRTFEFGKHGKAEITASATNVYDRPNIFYYDRVRAQRVNQLPILPSLSFTVQW